MKKTVTFLAILMAGVSFSQTFTWVDDVKTVSTELEPNTTVQLKIRQLAIANDSVTLGIRVVERNIPSDWDGMLCVYGLCYGSIREVGFEGEMSRIGDDTEGYVRLTVNPMDNNVFGKYRIYVYDIENPNDGDTATWLLNPSLGFEEEQLNAKVEVFPNPASDQITIQSDQKVNQLQIVDMTGKVVLNENNSFNGQAEINVSQLPKGMYTMVLRNESGLLAKRRISIL